MDTRREEPRSLLLRPDEELIGIPVVVNGEEFVRYSADEELPLDDPRRAARIQRVLDLAGAWSDLDAVMDWEQTLADLDRIRHDNPPSPPIDEQLDEL